jgi:hypothetical protein
VARRTAGGKIRSLTNAEIEEILTEEDAQRALEVWAKAASPGESVEPRDPA